MLCTRCVCVCCVYEFDSLYATHVVLMYDTGFEVLEILEHRGKLLEFF